MWNRLSRCCAMSKELIKQRMSKEKSKSEKEFGQLKRAAVRDEESDVDVTENFLREDPNIFLLNNLLLTVQFFENYDRDADILRENWFKEISLESHHKKCFRADSLFRESGAKVKFSSLRGVHINSKDFLHPLRIFISSDNMEAAFDPTNLGRVKKNVWPQYLFQVKMDENDEKQGSASLVLFNTLEQPKNHFDSTMLVNENVTSPYTQRKSTDGTKEKELGGTKKIFTPYETQARKISSKFFEETLQETIPPNSFYYFETPEESLNPVPIIKYRMNTILRSNHEIPQLCFQREVVKTTLETRRRIRDFSRPRNLLNSAAFKGYSCDLLLEKLAEPLGFDVADIQAGIIHEEFAIFGQKRKTHFCHAVEILDWNSFISLTEHRYNAKSTTEVAWPTNQMWAIIKTLRCYAVPHGVSDLSRKNQDHEKKWKIVFPEKPEINAASLGPNHLLHLFFWRVHKNFLAWPDERPAETLLSYLKILYKKLQNKFLRDFFINSRNLLAGSLAKDLHKAQALIKMILQNPVPYVLQAITNLEPGPNFYPAFKASEVGEILSPINAAKNRSKRVKEKIGKKVCFEDMEEHIWRKSIKPVQPVLKAEEQKSRKNPISFIETEKIVNFDYQDSQKFIRILEMFILHYMEMASISIEFKFTTQAFMYLFRIQSLFQLMSNNKLNNEDLKTIQLKINKLKDKCDELKREGKLNKTLQLGKTKFLAGSTTKLKNQQKHTVYTENDTYEKQRKLNEKSVTSSKVLKKSNSSDHLTDQNDEWETKL